MLFQSGTTVKKQEKVVFIPESKEEEEVEVAGMKMEGDPGQGKEEDKDLYTTRTA